MHLVSNNGNHFPTPNITTFDLPIHDWDTETESTGEPHSLEGNDQYHKIIVLEAGSCKGEPLGLRHWPWDNDDPDDLGFALAIVPGVSEGQHCDLYDSGAT